MHPAAPVADLELYIFPVDAAALTRTGTVTDRREYAGATDPRDPQSTGPDRSHSDVNSDGHQVSDQDEAVYGTNPKNAGTDELVDISLPMAMRSPTGPIPSCLSAQASARSITTAMG
jgi:hypothetical protein